MAELLSLSELALMLAVEEDQQVLDDLRKQAIDAFHRATARSERPFQDAQSGRVEVKAGNGSCRLWLDYPITALTTITLGRSSPYDDTLDPTDPDVLVFAVGERWIERVDGGVWGCRNSPQYIRVTYDAAADLPADARLAVKRRAAALWRETNRAQATSDRALDDTEDLPFVSDQDPTWDDAVSANMAVVL